MAVSKLSRQKPVLRSVLRTAFRSMSGFGHRRGSVIVWVIVALLLVSLVLMILMGVGAIVWSISSTSSEPQQLQVVQDPPYTDSYAKPAKPAKPVKPVKHVYQTYLDDPGIVGLSDETKFRRLSNFTLDAEDNIVACDRSAKVVRVITADDTLKSSWSLSFSPHAVAVCDDGKIIVTGSGKIAMLGDSGNVISTADIPSMISTSLTVSGDDVFVAVRESSRYAVYRMNKQFGEQIRIIDGLRGCCRQMDAQARGGDLYVAENGRSRIVKYDRDGKKLSSFGRKGRGDGDTFNGCCEPKNVCFDKEGNIYTSESTKFGVKKFSPDGKFLEDVGKARGIRGCVRLTSAITKDGSKIYMLDKSNNVIRLVQKQI